ncbi:hypothetical protein [Modestobacter sp. I12A-02662]
MTSAATVTRTARDQRVALLSSVLAEQGLSYDEFVWSLIARGGS